MFYPSLTNVLSYDKSNELFHVFSYADENEANHLLVGDTLTPLHTRGIGW